MSKKINDIFRRQNEEKMQKLVVAQHYAYSSAKRFAVVLFFTLVVFPLGINIALFFKLPEITVGILSFVSIALLFLGEFLRTLIERIKITAAMVQQAFDIYVFELDYNFSVDENEVSQAVQKFTKKDWGRKKDWYNNYESLDKNKTIFYCQKENIDWTGNLSRKYKGFLIGMICILLLSFVINVVINNSSIINVLSIVVTALPVISYGISGFKKIKQDDNKRGEIEKFANFINKNMDNMLDDEFYQNIVCLQILLYELRKTKYLIPDWFERIYYKTMQSIENRKARERISNYKKRK